MASGTEDLSMWVEQPASGRWSEGDNGAKTFTLCFRAARGNGRAMAVKNNYVTGSILRIPPSVILRLSEVNVERDEAYDNVDIVYRAADSKINYPTASVDGKIHDVGDHEFTVEATVQAMVLQAALAEGYIESVAEYSENKNTDSVDVPVLFVVWKSWLGRIGTTTQNGLRSVLPNTAAGCNSLIASCVGGTSSLDNGPRINKTVEFNNKLKCTDIRFMDDGKLLLREARMKYRPYKEW